MEKVDSSNIEEIGFGKGTLMIKFRGGAIYEFYSVPEEIFFSLKKAGSKGSFFHYNIKSKYDYKKISDEKKKKDIKVVTESIIEELDKRIKSGIYDHGHLKGKGIRSAQVMALVDMLVEKGVLK